MLLPGRAVRHSEGLGAGHPWGFFPLAHAAAGSRGSASAGVPEEGHTLVPGICPACLLKGTLWSRWPPGSEAGLHVWSDGPPEAGAQDEWDSV